MPRLEVTPDAVENAGAAMERNASETSALAATVDGLGGAAGGMSDAVTAAVYEELCAVWGIALEQLAAARRPRRPRDAGGRGVSAHRPGADAGTG